MSVCVYVCAHACTCVYLCACVYVWFVWGFVCVCLFLKREREWVCMQLGAGEDLGGVREGGKNDQNILHEFFQKK